MTRQPRACWNRTSPRSVHRACRTGGPRLLLTLVLLACLPGCQFMIGGERTVAQENERLRRANRELEQQNAKLQTRVYALQNDMHNLRDQLAREDDGPAIDGVEQPRLSDLGFSRLSGPVDLDGNDRHDVVRVYLQTEDQQGRILPVAGRVTLRALRIPEEGEPQVVVERIYEPDELDAAWRHSFAGIHYTLELPLPETLPAGTTELTVHASLLEATTGARHTHQQAITVRR